MSEWGLSETGFKPKPFTLIKEELELELKKTIDPMLRFTPDTIAGQLTNIIALQTRKIWEMAAALYSSLDSNAASGRALDALCELTGTYRKQAAPSKAVIQATLAAGAKIPQGTIVADKSNAKAQFKTLQEVKNDSRQEKSFPVEVIAEEKGPVYVEAGKLTEIITRHPGLLSINNPEDAVVGRNIETDAELRLRRIEELSALGSSTAESMPARLRKINSVKDVHIEERTHEFCAYVMGGDEQEIAETIWRYKPLGVQTFGAITKEVSASNGQLKSISFSRPIIIELSLHLNLKVKQIFSSEEISLLRDAITTYCKEKFSMGDVPYPSQIYPLLFSQTKVLDVISIQLRHNNRADAVPQSFKPFELFHIASDKIHIEQILEARA